MALSELLIGTTTFHVDVIEAVTKCDIDMSTSGQTEITLELADPNFRLLATNLFQRKTLMTLGDLKCEIAVVETSDSPPPQGLSIKSRSYAVQKFKRTKDAIVRRNISPTEFLISEARLVGAAVIGQPSAKRPQIARVNTENEQQSTWDVMSTLAGELGYEFYESANTFYFGQPSWLIARTAKWNIVWPANDLLNETEVVVLNTPQCRASENAKEASTVTLVVDRKNGVRLRPGDPVNFTGVPQFNGVYIIEGVTYSEIAVSEPVAVTLTTPIDPEVKGAKSTKSKKAVTELDGPALAVDQAALIAWSKELLGA